MFPVVGDRTPSLLTSGSAWICRQSGAPVDPTPFASARKGTSTQGRIRTSAARAGRSATCRERPAKTNGERPELVPSFLTIRPLPCHPTRCHLLSVHCVDTATLGRCAKGSRSQWRRESDPAGLNPAKPITLIAIVPRVDALRAPSNSSSSSRASKISGRFFDSLDARLSVAVDNAFASHCAYEPPCSIASANPYQSHCIGSR